MVSIKRSHIVIILLNWFNIICDISVHGLRENRLDENLRNKNMVDAMYSNAKRLGGFLSLFTYIQFSNQQCIATSGEIGTCLAAAECSQRGGTAGGPCAGGYGTCCIFVTSCSRTIRENNTYFVNNGYPNSYNEMSSCQVTLIKSNADICQFRLDFEQLKLVGPEMMNHICDTDQFIVSGSNPIPTICGDSTSNHMYLDAGAGINSPITLSVVTGAQDYGRNWKIRISQIPCNSVVKAEGGCLQYFTGVSGQILSYNYDPLTGAQLSNQNYGICIRVEKNFCGIQYNQCPDTVTENNRSQSFTLTGNSNNRVSSMVGSFGPNSCQADYLVIPMASNVGRSPTAAPTTVDRICGGTFNADISFSSSTVKSSVKPFHLWFHTDGIEAPNDIDNKGFCLNYVQQPCSSSVL